MSFWGDGYLKYLHRRFSSITSALLIFGLLPFISVGQVSPTFAATLPDCATSGYTSGGVTITPSHGKVMYIDTGVSPKIDAAYIGYRITNNGGSPLRGYWVSVTNFRGGVIGLANQSDQNQQLVDSFAPLPEVAAGASKTVYFLVKANSSTRIAQVHTVGLYSNRPDVVGLSATSECDFSFTKVAETIKAAANKVTSVVTSGSLSIGQLISVTVQGASGTIGAGSPDVGQILWFSPAAFSSFPTAALRLESVQLVISPDNANFNNSADIRIYNERLLITPSITPESTATGYSGTYKALLTTADSLSGKRYYKNVYRFRIIGKSAAPAALKPVAQISSGTQIKHTDLGAVCNSCVESIATDTVSTPVTVSKGLSTGSFYVGTGSYADYVRASYRVTVATTATGEVSVDEVVDTPPSGAIFAGSASYRVGSGSSTAITPVRIDSENGLSPQPYHFIGPFRITSSNSVQVDYQMYIPVSTGTYSNTAKAIIGQQVITTSSGYQLPGVSITTNGSGVTSTGSTLSTLNPEPVTLPASVSSGSTYLNGTVDANNQASTVTFEYSQNASLSTYTSVTVGSTSTSSPVGFTYLFTGSVGTTYYYRIVATVNSSSTRYLGDIQNFTTLEPVGTPTATTNLPISVGSTVATIAGQVDPNLNTMSEIRFKFSTGSTTTSVTSGSSGLTYATLTGSTLVFQEFDENGTLVGNTTAGGSSPTDFSWNLTGLVQGTTYYYQIEAVYPSGTVVGGVKSFKTGTTPQTITFSAGSAAAFSLGTKTETGTSSASLPLTYTSESPGTCSVNASTGVITFIAVGTCTITASQDGDATTSAATPVTSSFEILPNAPVVNTGSATSIGQRSATLNGTVNVGGASSTDVHFLYSQTQSEVTSGSGGTRVNAAVATITENGSSTYSLTGLALSTTYYYRIEATNTTGTSAGSAVSFTTLGLTSRTLSLSVASATLIFGAGTFESLATPSDGASEGTKSWSSATTGVCTVVSSTGVVTILSQGTCSLNASITSGSTFASASATQLDLTIAPKPVTITASDKSCNNCSTAPTFTFTNTPLVGSDAISGLTYNFSSASSPVYASSTTAPTKDISGAGTYVITPSSAALSPGTLSNYSFTYVNGTYSVTTLSDQTITFTTGSSQTYKTPFTVSATVSSGSAVTFSVSGNCTAAAPLEVASGTGTVTITPTAFGTNNCTITASQAGGGTFGPASSVSQTISIAKANLTVTPASQTLTFGDAVPSYTFTYGAFKDGDSAASSVGTAPTCTSSYTNSTSVTSSPLTITCSGGVSTNYAFSYQTNTLTINKANQTITFTDPADIYDDEGPITTSPTSSSGRTVVLTSNTPLICTVSGFVVTVVTSGNCSLTASEPGNDDYNPALDVTNSVTISSRTSGGGGGGSSSGGERTTTPAEPSTPGPTITSISRVEICAIGNEVVITGNYFEGGSVSFNGNTLIARSVSGSSIIVTLPSAIGGTHTIRVTTQYGFDSVTIKYVDVPKPRFIPVLIPYMSQGAYLSIPVSASNASSYVLEGFLPNGLRLDPNTGAIAGTPAENGIFVFAITARGICGENKQTIELDIDKPTPNAISHRINFLPGEICFPGSAKASLENFLEKVKAVAPRNLVPEIYFSGGGIGSGSLLGEQRRDCLCDFFLEEEVFGPVITGEFSGSLNRVEIIVYWARP